jgi:hypothetical protein
LSDRKGRIQLKTSADQTVLTGLDANDKVIVAGLQKIFAPDTKVKPNLVQQQPSGSSAGAWNTPIMDVL